MSDSEIKNDDSVVVHDKVPAGVLNSESADVPSGEPVGFSTEEPLKKDVPNDELPKQEPPKRRFFHRKHVSSEHPVPPVISGKHRVNKVVYFLLAFFFGAMGIHKFYAGHIFSGIVFLALFFVGFLFTFIFGLGFLILTPLELIALIQGIIGLCRTTGPDGKIQV